MDSYVESRSAGYRVRCVGMVVMSLVYELVIGKHGHGLMVFIDAIFFIVYSAARKINIFLV